MADISAVRRDSLVLVAAVAVVAITFGVLAGSAGLGLPKSMAMSLFVFTGASQFAAVGVVSAGGSTVSAIGGALLLAARNSLYGMRLSSLVRASAVPTTIGSQLVIDESTAMSLAQETDEERRVGFWWTGVGIFVCWNLGTIAGVLLGDVVGDPLVYGLDAAFPASFVALILPHVRTPAGQIAAAVAAIVALVGIPLLPAGVPVLVSALAVLPAWLITRSGDGDEAMAVSQ